MVMRYFITLIMICAFVLAKGEDDASYVQISIPVACMREEGSHSSQLVSQTILGTPMRVLAKEGEWWALKGPDDYEGYVNISGFVPMPTDRLEAWKRSQRLMVNSIREAVVLADSLTAGEGRNVLSSLVNGSVVEGVIRAGSEFVKITLPDGRMGYMETSSVVPLDSLPPLDMEELIDKCYSLMDTPYLWGGCSTKSMDCSGLVRLLFLNYGLLLPRDACDQFKIGSQVHEDLRRGDLMFFSTTPEGAITHVALYDNDNQYIHCSGKVKVSGMSENDPDFSHRYYRGARRVYDSPECEGIKSIKSHSWYF